MTIDQGGDQGRDVTKPGSGSKLAPGPGEAGEECIGNDTDEGVKRGRGTGGAIDVDAAHERSS